MPRLADSLALLVLLVIGEPATAALPPSPPQYGFRMETATIPMRDGVRLAVTLYLPDGAPREARFPALLEYLPYRKDDDEASRDYGNHSYFARRGYVGARVDVRGFGNSEGTPPPREYSAQEQADGEQVIAWLARQPWSNGRVGMLGISWGGFNSIQLAMRKPPALKAILAVAATEELYKEDVHYTDGIFHVDEFELTMDLDQGRSGAPGFSLDEAVIGPRMDSSPWSLLYMQQQHDGEFWRSPVRPLEGLTVPCFLIGGLQDGYRDSIPRMLERAPAPMKAWVGPWNHDFPNSSMYGPRYEWRDQAVRWFDYWLKDRDTGVRSDPRMIVYMQHSHPPGAEAQDVPGEWRAESWPPAGLKPRTLYLSSGHALAPEAPGAARDRLRYVPSAGVEAGFWWGELLSDQRPADSYSLVYESAPLPSPLAILGSPRALLRASSDAKLAHWFVKLEDVDPDGRVTIITGAALNGAQRNSLSSPEDLKPGRVYALPIDLHLTSWVFEPGHRVRLAVSNALWPMTWPTPYAMTTALELGGADASRLVLPEVPVSGNAPAPFASPEVVEERTDIKAGEFAWPGTWTSTRDEGKHTAEVIWHGEASADYPWGHFAHTERLTYDVDDAHPESASVLGESTYDQAIPGHLLGWRGRLEVRSDVTTFHYHYIRELLRDGVSVRKREWRKDIPRDHQ
jgi:uncharacterized protein